VVSIESDKARRLDMTDVINTFATSKVRKKHFSGELATEASSGLFLYHAFRFVYIDFLCY